MAARGASKDSKKNKQDTDQHRFDRHFVSAFKRLLKKCLDEGVKSEQLPEYFRSAYAQLIEEIELAGRLPSYTTMQTIFDYAYLQTAVNDCNGDKNSAMKLTKLPETTFYRKLRKSIAVINKMKIKALKETRKREELIPVLININNLNYHNTIRRVETELLNRVLEKYNWNVADASSELGLNSDEFNELLKRHNIEMPS